MKKTVNVLKLIALIVLFAGCTLRPVDNTTLGVEIPGETLENLLTPFMYSYPQGGSEYKPYFKLTWEYQGNRWEEMIPVLKITGCENFLLGKTDSISGFPKIFTINDIPVGSSLTANLELFDAYGFALYSSKTVEKSIKAQDKSLTLDLYSTSPVVYCDFSSSNSKFYGVADDSGKQIFTLSQGQSDLSCSLLQPRSFPYVKEKTGVGEAASQPRVHYGTMIATNTSTRAVIPPESSFGPVEEPLSITLEKSDQTPQWVAGGTDFSKNKIWAVHEKRLGEVERILCYGGKYYTISLDSTIPDGDPLLDAYNYGSSINWAVDNDNLYAVIRYEEQSVAHYFLRGAIQGEPITLSDTGFKFTEPSVPASWTEGGITGANGITDATARDGDLYFLYCQRHNNQTETRGFLYTIPDAESMSKASNAKTLSGWEKEEFSIPQGGPMENKLYNPLRFVAVKPEKLYIADGGFSKAGGTTNNSDMNRIMVFDLLNSSSNSSSVKVHKDLGGEHQLAYGSGGYTAY